MLIKNSFLLNYILTINKKSLKMVIFYGIYQVSPAILIYTLIWVHAFLIVCLFVCLGFIVILENFSLIRRRHHDRWRAANFDQCSALIAIEKWRFFSVKHLLWHGASVSNGHLQGLVTLTAIAERLAVKVSLPLLTT